MEEKEYRRKVVKSLKIENDVIGSLRNILENPEEVERIQRLAKERAKAFEPPIPSMWHYLPWLF